MKHAEEKQVTRHHSAVGNKSVPIQLAQCWSLGWPFPMHKYISQIKYMEGILSNSARKLLWFEITKMLIAFEKNLLCHLL